MNAVNVRWEENPEMHTFLIAVGCAWFAAALLFVFALGAAARRPLPSSLADLTARKPGRNRRRQPTPKIAAAASSPELFAQAGATFAQTGVKDEPGEVREAETVASQAR